MKALVSSFFAKDVKQYIDELACLHEEISPEAHPAKDEFSDRLQRANVASLSACRELERLIGPDDGLLLETQARFRDAIQPWFDQSWFMERGKSKPRGYPGDYELLIGIYDGVAKSTGLGGYLDRYFLNSPLADAVRQRLNAARQFLLSEVKRQRRSLRLLNVACGPCREYTQDWEAGGRPVSVMCLDMDREAIAYVDRQATVAASVGLQLETKTYNALRMSSVENNLKHFGRPDVIYSIGLCDYLPDNSMIRILRGWRETLAPGGIVYVAFKDCREYDKTGYAWHVDWHFIPRTDEDCRRLFAEAGYDMDDVQLRRCKSPIIMSYVCRQTVDAPICAESGSPAAQTAPDFVAN